MTHPLQFGDCLFETVRVENDSGGCRRLDLHLQRFERSAQALGYSAETIAIGLDRLNQLRWAAPGLWRLTFTRDADVFGTWTADVLADRRDIPEPFRPRLCLVNTYLPDDTFAEHKTTSYLASMQARRTSKKLGFDDAIRISRTGRVGEASMANIFLVVAGAIHTPVVEGLLPGTTRAAILDAARSRGVSIVESVISLDVLEHAAEIILTSAGVLATSALSLNDRPLQEHWGPIFRGWLCS